MPKNEKSPSITEMGKGCCSLCNDDEKPKDDPAMGFVVCPKCDHKWCVYGSDLV